MWYAVIFVAVFHPVSGTTFLKFMDNRGPYGTVERCEERRDEMIAKVPEVVGFAGGVVLNALPLPCQQQRPEELDDNEQAI